MESGVVSVLLWGCAFLLMVAAVEHYLRRAVIPPVCWILLAGVAAGALRRHTGLPLPSFGIGPRLVLYVFLPLLVFDSSRKLHPRQLLAVLPESALLALLGPVLGMLLLGLPLHLMVGVPVLDALLFGTVLSAVRPAAITALFERFSVPDRLRTIVEGESLLNDAAVIVLFTILAGRMTGHLVFSAPETFGWFLISFAVALLIGAVAGGACVMLLRTWQEQHDRFIGALLPLVTVYVAFAVAEHYLHFPGVLAAISATLVLGHLHIHRDGRSRVADRFFNDFWGFLRQVANVVLFFAIGALAGGHAWRIAWWSIPTMIGLMLLARATTVYGGLAVMGLVRRKVRSAWKPVLNLGGLKGALSVALLMMLPTAYEHRNFFLCLAFALILFTIIVNTLAMKLYLDHTELDSG